MSEVKRGSKPIQDNTNEATERLAPDSLLKEICNVFHRILNFIDSVGEGEVIMLAKIDLSDGFWRMIMEKEDKWNFAYVMPDRPGTPPRLVVPSDMQMEWSESPAYFCVATETGQYLIDQRVEQKVLLPIHTL